MLKGLRARVAHAISPQPQKSYPNVWANGGNWTFSGTVGHNRDLIRDDEGAALAAIIMEDVYGAVQARTQAIGSLKWEIRRRAGNRPDPDRDEVVTSSGDVVPGHPLALALHHFRVHNKFDLFQIWHYCHLVTGKAFLQPLQNPYGYYTGVEWYNPLNVTIQEPAGVITGYQYSGRGKTRVFMPEELIYDKYALNLADENQGQSPVETAIDSLNIERNIKRAYLAYFRNHMTLGAVLSPLERDVLREEDMDRLQRDLKAENVGVDNTGKNLLVPIPVEINYPQQPDLRATDTAAERAAKKIERVMGVPAAIMGDMGETRYKEHQDMYDAWFVRVPLADARNIQDVVNLAMMPLYDPSGETYFMFDESEWTSRIIPADIDRREAARLDLDSGAITLARYNMIVGNDADEDPALDFRYLPADKLMARNDQLPRILENASIPADKLPDMERAQADTLETAATVDAQTSELRAWERFASKGNRKRAFRVEVLRGDVEHYVRAALAESLPDVWSRAHQRLQAHKAIQATRLEFEAQIEDTIFEARQGNITRPRFGTIMRRAIERYGRQAYIDGLVDGGVVGGELTPDDETTIQDMIAANSTFVTELGARLYGDGITDAEAAEKPLLWWNKTLRPFYDEGLLSANRNQMLEFAGEDGDESCRTCQALKGQRHRASSWKARALRPGVDTDNFGCGGWRCQHILVPTQERARGTFPTPQQIAAWAAAGKSCDHAHDDDPPIPQPYTDAQRAAYYATDGYTDLLR